MKFTFFIGIITLMHSSLAVWGQDTFADMSAKERIAVAEQEEAQAAGDEAFQQQMLTGHDYFKNKHYLKAIRAYEEAQRMRPNNVYPKVIIADIELSMRDTLDVLRKAEKEALRKAKKEDRAVDKPLQEKPSETPSKAFMEESKEERLEKINEWEAQERAKLEAQRKARQEAEKREKEPALNTGGDVQVISEKEMQVELAQRYPTGITEEISREGNRIITKRIVVANGTGNEYKKVSHSWGGIFYFKNGEAVTERVWLEETQ